MHESLDQITDPNILALMLLFPSPRITIPNSLPPPNHPIHFSSEAAAEEHYQVRLRAAQAAARIQIAREETLQRNARSGHKPVPEGEIEADPALFRAFIGAVMQRTVDRPDAHELLGFIGSMADQAKTPFHIHPSMIQSMLALAQDPSAENGQIASVTDLNEYAQEQTDYAADSAQSAGY